MLALYGEESGKRRTRWTPGTIAVSIMAHGAVIGALIGFAKQAEARPVTEEVIAEWNLADKPKPPPPPPPPPPLPEPPAPKEPPKVELAPKVEAPRAPRHVPAPPVKGDFVSPRPPETPPSVLPAANPNA